MKKASVILVVSVIVLVLFVLLAIGSGETTEPEKVDKTSSEKTTDEKTDEDNSSGELYSIGDTVKMGDLEFTLNSVRFDSGSEFMKPKEDEKWVVVDVELKNNGEESESISSIIMFKMNDEENYSLDMAYGAETRGSLDGELGAGRTMKGEIAYSVSDDNESFEFIFEPNAFGFGQAIYEFTVKDIN